MTIDPYPQSHSAGQAVAPTDAPRPAPRDPAEDAVAATIELLAARGADRVEHPGGTLLAHLRRVHALLERWEASTTVRLAGLAHAYYGTDGFPTALGEVSRREELAAVVGEEAERLVYFYASCDRAFSYGRLGEPGGRFRDRFTGAVLVPPGGPRQDFAEITVANELDIVTVNPELRERYGRDLLTLFTSWQCLLDVAAWRAVRATLP